MPQLDFSSFPSQIFWLVIFFATLYIAMSRLLLPRVESILSIRAANIRNNVAQAEKMTIEARFLSDEYEVNSALARKKSKEIIAAAQAKMNVIASEKNAEMTTKIDKKLAEANNRIKTAKENALSNITPLVADVASAMVLDLAGYQPASADVNLIVKGQVL